MKKIILLGIFVVISGVFQNTFSQIKSTFSENIHKPKFKSSKTVRQLSVSKESINEMLKQDSIESTYGAPFRFGKNISVDIDFIKLKSHQKIVLVTHCIIIMKFNQKMLLV